MDNKFGRVWTFLLIGVISLLYAEVFSGSSPLWFIKPSSILITLPFYILHIVFFLNIAIKFHRTNTLSLYHLGVIYGLYESWFTTVILYGYINKTPVLGSLLGISMWEFTVLVFFWHPVMSFIMTIITFQSLTGENNLLFGVPILNSNRLITRIIWFALLFLGASVLSMYTHFNILVSMGSYLGTLALMYLFYIASKKSGTLNIESLIVGNKSLMFVGFIILFLYLIGFYYHSKGNIVDYKALLVIFGFYILEALMFHLSEKTNCNEVSVSFPNIKNLQKFFTIAATLILVNCLFAEIVYPLDVILTLTFSLLGSLLFLSVTILTIKNKIHNHQTSYDADLAIST